MEEGKRKQILLEKRKKKKKITYIVVAILCVLLIAIGAYFFFRPDETTKTPYGIEIVQSMFSKDKEISEKDARKIAVKQFEKLGEKIDKDALKVLKIERDDGFYYFISSANNTLEVRIKGGNVTRINAIPVNQ